MKLTLISVKETLLLELIIMAKHSLISTLIKMQNYYGKQENMQKTFIVNH